MSREHNCNDSSCPQRVSRRNFLKIAAAAGLLAGCRPPQQPPATPVSSPSASLGINSAEGLTSEPTTAPTSAATATPTSGSTATPMPADAPPRTPDVLSKVVHARHAGVWDGDALVSEAIRQMLDASITQLIGLGDATEAWAALFDPGERIVIKVNAFRNSLIWTHVPLVMAVTDCLQEAGIPAEQIVIFDYLTRELKDAGYPVNQDGPGVRCYGSDSDYTAGWTVTNTSIALSDILLNCNALINIPVLKSHMIAGISFAMKNHYGTFSRPESLHRRIGHAMAELNALPPIKDTTRLIIGDVLTACLRYANSYPYWRSDMTGDSIFMSFDPVAHDTVGLEVFSQLLTDDGGNPAAATGQATPWLESGAELGLGTNDPDNIELVEISLG